MRFRFDLHFSLGKDDPEPGRDSDHTGSVLDVGDTTTGLGFVGPGPKVDEAWEE